MHQSASSSPNDNSKSWINLMFIHQVQIVHALYLDTCIKSTSSEQIQSKFITVNVKMKFSIKVIL